MLVLASQSPRRADLLAQAGIPFVVRPAPVEERRGPGESPEEYVVRLAREKARAARAAAGEVVLGADTVVVAEGAVLEKPEDEADAARMLRALSGRAHEVLTGFCLLRGKQESSGVSRTLVRFARMSEEEIAWYAGTGEPRDKAGAYAIQGLASRFIEGIEGCYFNVVGLPVPMIYRRLREMGELAG